MKHDDDDLIGDTSKKSKGAAKKGSSKKAETKKGVGRGKRDGNAKFPRSGAERTKMREMIAKKVKAKISLADFAEQNELDLWKVRLAAKDLVQAKRLKQSKSGEDGGGRIMVAPR